MHQLLKKTIISLGAVSFMLSITGTGFSTSIIRGNEAHVYGSNSGENLPIRNLLHSPGNSNRVGDIITLGHVSNSSSSSDDANITTDRNLQPNESVWYPMQAFLLG